MIPASSLAQSLAYAGGAAAATALGAVLGGRTWTGPGRLFHGLMAASAGLLMGLSVFSLTLPAGRLLGFLPDLALVLALLGGLVLGALGLLLLRAGAARVPVHAGPWLVLMGLALHDVPEGLAIGTAVAAPGVASALPVALGIGFQNLLDGALAVLAVRAFGWSPVRAMALVALAGLVEVGASLVGTLGAGLFPRLLPLVLLGTAGAMIELVRSEVLPSLRRREGLAWLPLLLAGVLVIPVLGVWLWR